MVLHQQWHSSNFNPGHYVAIDVPNQTIVVAFRGTFHTKDAVSDPGTRPGVVVKKKGASFPLLIGSVGLLRAFSS